jgi:hypothetical protein
VSLTTRALLGLALCAGLIAGWWRLTAHFEAKGYARAQAEGRQLADVQAQRMRELQRAAELRYTVAAETRDRFIVTTVKEVRHATEHLDSCRLGIDAVRLFNDAAACARADSSAACGAGEPVRGAP